MSRGSFDLVWCLVFGESFKGMDLSGLWWLYIFMLK